MMLRLEEWLETFSKYTQHSHPSHGDTNMTRIIYKKLQDVIRFLHKHKARFDVSLVTDLNAAKEAFVSHHRKQALDIMYRIHEDKVWKKAIVNVLFQLVTIRIEMECHANRRRGIDPVQYAIRITSQLQQLDDAGCPSVPSEKVLAGKLARLVGYDRAHKNGPTVGTYIRSANNAAVSR